MSLLTSRELQVVELLAQGLTNKEIAYHLNIAEGTLRNHTSNIYRKLGHKRRFDVISMYFKGEIENAQNNN